MGSTTKYTEKYIEIKVIVTPNAKSSKVIELGKNLFKVKVDAPAIDGKANARLLILLSKHFNIKSSKIHLKTGARSREKLFLLEIGT